MDELDLDDLCRSLALLSTGVTIFRAVNREGRKRGAVVDALVVYLNPAIEGHYGLLHAEVDRTGMLFHDIFYESVELGIWRHYKYVLERRRPWSGRVHYEDRNVVDYFDVELVPLGDDMVLGFHRDANQEVRALATAMEMSATLMETITMVFESTRSDAD